MVTASQASLVDSTPFAIIGMGDSTPKNIRKLRN